MHDILARLRMDAGQLTVATLIQEREAAAAEIERLQRTIERPITSNHASPQSAPKLVSPKVSPTPVPGPNAILRLNDLCKMLGVGRSTIYKWVSDGTFPRPLKIAERAVRWPMKDIERWRDALEQ